MRKKIIIGIIIAAAAVFAGLLIFNLINKKEKITGNDRLLLEKTYMDNMAEYVDQLDRITAAYISGQIDKGAYLDRHKTLEDEFYIIKEEYSIWQDLNPIQTGTESYVSKRGEQAVKKAQDDIDGLLNASFKSEDELYDIYELYYRYLAQKEKVRLDYVEYTVAYRWILEADTMEEDMEAVIQEFENRKDEEGEKA